MVLPLLKAGRLTLKTMGKSFSTRIRPKYNGRMANTEALTLNKDKAALDLTVADVLFLSVGAAAVLFGVRGYARFRAEGMKMEEELSEKIEELKERLRIKRGRIAEAKRGLVGFEAKDSRD